MSKLSPAQLKTEKLGDALLKQERAQLEDRELSPEEIAALPGEPV